MIIDFFNLFLQICRNTFTNELTMQFYFFIVLMALIYMLRKVMQQ